MAVFDRIRLGLCILPLLLAPSATAQKQFFGTLHSRLVATENRDFVHWQLAAPKDLRRFKERPVTSAIIRVGVIELGNKAALKFSAAFVEIPRQPACLYVDRRHRNLFDTSDRVCFNPLPATAPYAAEAEIALPLPAGAFQSFPLVVDLPRADNLDPHDGTAPTLLPSSKAMVTGEVALPNRKLFVGYVYDPGKGTADPTNCLQFADLNGDKKLDYLSESDMGDDGKAPIFHVGPLYLRTKNVDLARRRVTLNSVGGAEYTRIDLWPGATVPDFTFKTLDGETKKLSDVKGKLVLLDFWATWCVACVADLPSKLAIYQKYHSRGFEILGMDGGETSIEAPKKLVAKLGLSWIQGKPSGDLLTDQFHIASWPTAVLLDDHRRVVTRDLGELSGRNLDKTLSELLPAN